MAEDLFARAEKHIFSEQVTDTVLDEAAVKADLEKYAFFAIESLPGQFDQRAASSQEALLLLGSSNDVTVNTAQLYLVNKDIDANELEAVKNYLLNPVDSRFKDITVGTVSYTHLDKYLVLSTCREEDETIRSNLYLRQIPDSEMKDFVAKHARCV